MVIVCFRFFSFFIQQYLILVNLQTSYKQSYIMYINSQNVKKYAVCFKNYEFIFFPLGDTKQTIHPKTLSSPALKYLRHELKSATK